MRPFSRLATLSNLPQRQNVDSNRNRKRGNFFLTPEISNSLKFGPQNPKSEGNFDHIGLLVRPAPTIVLKIVYHTASITTR